MKVKVVIAIAIMSMNVFSADAKIEKAKELMKTMEITKNIDASFDQITTFSEKMIDSQGLSEDQVIKAKEIAKRSMEISFSNMKKIDWETIFSEIYVVLFQLFHLNSQSQLELTTRYNHHQRLPLCA